MNFGPKNLKFGAFVLSLVWTFSAIAEVQSLQGSYRKLLEKTYQVQTGQSLSLNQLLYQLPLEALQEKAGESAQTKFQIWNRENVLIHQTKTQMISNVGSSEKDLFDRESLRKNPVTLVVVPGVFGEFIDPLAFNEITGSQQSTLSPSFKNKIQSLSQSQGLCQSGGELHCDFHFSLDFMALDKSRVRVVALDELLSVTSLDDESGRPLVKIVLFKTPRMSLESVGEIQNIAGIFNRRLQKYFAIEGKPQKFAYVGYSRGTMVALEMLRQSQDASAKGLFAVGGVTWGSDLADQMLVSGSIMNRQLQALQFLASNLKLTHQLGFFEAGKTRLQNMHLWLKFFSELLISPGHDLQAFLKAQIAKGKSSDPRAIIGLALSVAANYGLIEQSPEFPYFSFHGISHEAYSLNVIRFQKFVDHAVKAATELTTPARLKWWTQAQLPKRLTFYSLTATLADPYSSIQEEKDLAQQQWASGPFNGADYLGLLENYRDLRKASGASLNDSQVAVAKVIAWPELIRSLNPNLEIQSKFLGLFGCHHWAFALPVVNVNKDKSVNPFPRSAFLESMAHVFAND